MERQDSVQHKEFNEFVETIATLRAPGGCPWDREQTHESIAHHMIEEAYEAVDAIEFGAVDDLREELGDVLLQVVLHCQIAADAGEFTIDDVCRDINEKMIRRHPHVFGGDRAEDAEQVRTIWGSVKLEELKRKPKPLRGPSAGKGLLGSVPASLPALMQALNISEKAVSVGFEWDTVDEIWSKVDEEIEEFRSADETEQEVEFGDVLFTLVNVGRRHGIDSEKALRASCAKFRERWSYIENVAAARSVSVEDLTMHELQALWDLSKLGV